MFGDCSKLTLSLNLLSIIIPFATGQQCRLVAPGSQSVGTPSDPFPGSSNSSSSNTTAPTPSSGNGTSTPTRGPFSYGKDIVRGVNLGGWFVLEPWITPSIFENTNNTNIVDEYTMGLLQDSSITTQVLKNHWETWITEEDFEAINAAGLNHVRIPYGYWSVPMNTSVAPYTPGAWPYLLQALNWAEAHDVHVIIDLHGAPGSQNGYDNSGQRTTDPVWGVNPANITRTLDVINYVAQELGSMVDVIELVNEPAGYTSSAWAAVIRQYWSDGYQTVREAAGSNVQVMIEDAFLGVQSWENFLTYPQAINVLMDTHQYQIFNDAQLAYSDDEHINYTCSLIPSLSSYASSNLFTIMGEWSSAATDCAKWLNGRGVGARWDGSISPGAQVFGSCDGLTGSSANFSSDYKTFLRKFWEAQADVGESVQGWLWWTWKAENADEWSYQKGLEDGWLPQDPTERLYPNLCGSS